MANPEIAADPLASFARLFDSTPPTQIRDQNVAAWNDSEGLYRRYDDAIKLLNLGFSQNAQAEFPFRRRDRKTATAAFGGAWFDGYVFGHAVYRNVLNAIRYSSTESEAAQNAGRLHGAVESMDIGVVVDRLFAAMEEYSREMFEHSEENQLVLRTLEFRLARGALTAAWANGILTAVLSKTYSAHR